MGVKTLRTILSSVTHNGKQVHSVQKLKLFLKICTYSGKKIILSPADFVLLLTDKEMISL